tara:strand:- start:9228 stop:9521 length:294 start_codon:yes stop_codon:yes gene_type:complete
MANWKNDQAAIDAALKDTDAKNPIAIEVANGIEGFMSRLSEQAERNGKWPTELLLHRPASAFDDTVIRLTLQALADEMGVGIDIHWVGEKNKTKGEG